MKYRINPYRSPRTSLSFALPTENHKSPLPTVLAVVWALGLIIIAPDISAVSTTPKGSFLGFKIVTTSLSLCAVMVLILRTAGWKRFLAIPLALLLCRIQLAICTNLP